MRTRAVPVWQNRERNFVRLIAERQKQALPVPVPIRGAEGSVNRSSPHRVHKVIIDEEVSMSWSNHECGRVHRNVYYFTPKIRVSLRVTQADAKRANANK